MKISGFLFLLLHNINFLFCQHYGNENKKETLKNNNVKTEKIYFSQNKYDSSISGINSYDTTGKIISSRTYSRNGDILGIDTFIYDKNNSLFKTLQLQGNNFKFEVNYTNDSNGKVIKSEAFHNDTLISLVYHFYDTNGRNIKSLEYYDKTDSTLTTRLYNSRGLITKIIWNSKQNGKMTIENEYDSRGNTTQSKRSDLRSKNFSTYDYDSNGNKLDATTISTSKIRGKTISVLKYYYYPNGLLFAKFLFVNKKQITLNNYFYEYY